MLQTHLVAVFAKFSGQYIDLEMPESEATVVVSDFHLASHKLWGG